MIPVPEILVIVCLVVGFSVFVRWLWRENGALPTGAESATTGTPAAPRLAKERVLFVCTHNPARSQMAEALLRHAASGRFDVARAGTTPTSVHPLAEKVMAERGLSLASHRAKALDGMGTRWDYVITVCDAAFERCPEFPAKTSRLH